MANIRSLSLILSLVFIVSCNSSGDVGDAGSLGTSGSTQAGDSRWSEADLPLTISLASDVTNAEKTSVSSTLDEWDNAVSSTSFFSTTPTVTDPEHTDLEDYRDGTIGIYNVEASDPLSDPSIDIAQALAVTQFFALEDGAGFRIIHADIFMNRRFYNFSTTSGPTTYDYESVVIHELGHLLGLGHVSFSTGDSVMNPSISTTTEKRSLFGIDDNNINDLYNDSASSASIKALSSSEIDEDKVVRVVTQLMPNGECHHYHDGAYKNKHKAIINK